ncbi:60S acidic ribosomal protein P2-like [Nilaparvata lugens]|uniref:60S acidic ribosomal protein P2-like n=1 Tax=Nilaparvata lugens TaxID=108931 RepID=UPI00193CE1B2|nr:60S acidic ribosomal protein P2-like [Nilaparvata lugens]
MKRNSSVNDGSNTVLPKTFQYFSIIYSFNDTQNTIHQNDWGRTNRNSPNLFLPVLGGKENPSSSDIEKILSSVGIEADSEKLNFVVGQLKGKSVDELIKQGKEKSASIPAGGGAAVTVAAGGAPAVAAAAPEKKEKERAEKEESDQSDNDMGFGLFETEHKIFTTISYSHTLVQNVSY